MDTVHMHCGLVVPWRLLSMPQVALLTSVTGLPTVTRTFRVCLT